VLGVWSSANDNYDAGIDVAVTPGGSGFAGVYHQNTPTGWKGPTGFYHTDIRALPAPLEGKTWDPLYVWAYPSYASASMYFSMQARYTLCDGEPQSRAAYPPANRHYLLELVGVPAGVVGAPPVGTVWEVPVGPTFTLTLPTYRTTNGLEGYRFAFTMTESSAIPGVSEWGLVAMTLLGMSAGTVVFGRRRPAHHH